MDAISTALLLRLQDALVASTRPSRVCTDVGGFVAMLTPTDPLVWLNYAVPVSASAVDGVGALVDHFASAQRTPRLEFFPAIWPGVAEALEAKGFTCEKRMPLMVLTVQDWQGLRHHVDVRGVDAESFHALNAVLADAFGMPPPSEIGDPLADPAYQRIASGTTFASAAFVDGVVVGGGCAVGTSEVREIAGIGTQEAYRKRGIASAVIAHLLDGFFGTGGEIAWLTPGDDAAQSVYTRLGFVPSGEQVCYALGP